MTELALLSDHLWSIASLGLLLLGSAFFSGSETALFSLSAAHRHTLAESRNWLGRLAVRLTRRPRRLLNTLLLGNMIVNVAFSSTAAVLWLVLQKAGANPWVLGVASLVPLLTLILFGEVMPKMLAYSAAPQWSVIAAGPIFVAQKIMLPVLWVLESVIVSPVAKIIVPHAEESENLSADEFAALMNLSARQGIIDHDAGLLLQEIVGLTNVKAADVMVPRVDVVSYNVDDGAAGLIELFRKSRLGKVPIFEKDLDNVLGVIHAKHLLLTPATPLADLLKPVSFVPESANLDRVLMQFRVTGKQMAIAVDEYGGSAGLITLEDILEEIVGDLPDTGEAELAQPVQKISDKEYLISADLSARQWAEVFRIDLSHHRISTIGGLVVWLMGKIPQVGDTITFRNLLFTAEETQGRRLRTLRLKFLEAEV